MRGRSASPASTTSSSLGLMELPADQHVYLLVETASGAGPGFGLVTIPVQEGGLFLTGSYAKYSKLSPFLPSMPTGRFPFNLLFVSQWEKNCNVFPEEGLFYAQLDIKACI